MQINIATAPIEEYRTTDTRRITPGPSVQGQSAMGLFHRAVRVCLNVNRSLTFTRFFHYNDHGVNTVVKSVNPA